MDDIKCPYCGQELKYLDESGEDITFVFGNSFYEEYKRKGNIYQCRHKYCDYYEKLFYIPVLL
jgi:hypothetical protein